MSDVILFEEIPAATGTIGRATLNLPNTLNALTLEMVDQLQAQLDNWRNDDTIAVVWIDGSGEKAFCAGGDVQALYRSATEQVGGPCTDAETFFEREYRTNYKLHRYEKPIICWGNGIVMGGGLGVMAGCSHRVVTEKTRIAMPEVGIALFPDVGGSWFLNHMPGNAGTFLALTGASINASDALYTGIADRFISSERKSSVIEALQHQHWHSDPQRNHHQVRHLLREQADASIGCCPAGQVEPHMATINRLCDGDSIVDIVDNINRIDGDDPWLNKARDSLRYASPLAVQWTYRQLFETRHSSLREVFQAELQLATNIMRHPEFAEGVRALLIDKDRQPDWQFKQVSDVSSTALEAFFSAPWPQNPLADLA